MRLRRDRGSRGSRPRCIRLTDGGRFAVAENLTCVVKHSSVIVSPSDICIPQGHRYPDEAQLDKPDGAPLVPQEIATALQEWWPRSGTSPKWDIASTCTINGRRGLLLVEAKAHSTELDSHPTDACGKSREQIVAALAEASDGLRRLTGEDWALSADDHHYQLANRIAWSWKLASVGMPTVLVYLGFLNAAEMTDKCETFATLAGWKDCMLEHSAHVVPPSYWDTSLHANGAPLMFLIRACSVACG